MGDTFIGLPPVYRGQDKFDVVAQGYPWHITDVALETYWDYTGGGNVLVGVADTGIDEDHPMIVKGRIKSAKAFAKSRVRGEADYYDGNDHGTHVATTIAQMAPNAKFCIAKVLGDNGSGSNRKVADGIRWLADEGCNIINLSLGGTYDDPDTRNAIKYAKTKGCIVCCATGNEAASAVGYPARHALGIGAIDRQRKLAWFSNRGKHVDITGYGVDILAGVPGGQYQEFSGTSMSSPWVAAIFANRLGAEIKHLGKIVTNSDSGLRELKPFVTDLGPEGRDTSYGLGMPDLTKCFQIKVDVPDTPDVKTPMLMRAEVVSGDVYTGTIYKEKVGP